mgnify:CR=1 FL=1
MKREELLKKAFRTCQQVLRHYAEKGFDTVMHNPVPTYNAITLAWALDIMPPHMDECVTDRLIGDERKPVTVDIGALLDFLLKVEVP